MNYQVKNKFHKNNENPKIFFNDKFTIFYLIKNKITYRVN